MREIGLTTKVNCSSHWFYNCYVNRAVGNGGWDCQMVPKILGWSKAKPSCFNDLLLLRTTDTKWRNKSKKSENLGRCCRQNMLQPYLNIWEWELIFGRAVKAISSPGVRSPWVAPSSQCAKNCQSDDQIRIECSRFWTKKFWFTSITYSFLQKSQNNATRKSHQITRCSVISRAFHEFSRFQHMYLAFPVGHDLIL